MVYDALIYSVWKELAAKINLWEHLYSDTKHFCQRNVSIDGIIERTTLYSWLYVSVVYIVR